jgi:hypothetical protein
MRRALRRHHGRHFRARLFPVLGAWMEDGARTLEEANRIATTIGLGNANRVYALT